MTRQLHFIFRIGIAFSLLLILAWLVYKPGTQGSFIFDDLTNLAPLGARGGVVDWQSFVHYLRSGFAGPTGRPLSLLSFLVDANYWPAHAEAFKRTNILLHLVNGCLLFWLMSVLLSVIDSAMSTARQTWIALAVAALWMLHPYLVSTTLYVVQRMAMLATCFVFAGLVFWIKGRILLATQPRRAYVQMSFALFAFSFLATFSKENGAILPVLALAIECFMLRRVSGLSRPGMWWQGLFLVLPAVMIGLYLLYIPVKNGLFADYASRDFSPWERLLTQARVLWIYVEHWFIPRMTTTGVFHDNLVVSESLIKPASTALSITAWGAIFGITWKFRKTYPLIIMSLSAWLLSLLIESSTVGLEMLFEHRMYMGGGFLFLPAVYYSAKYVKTWKMALATVIIIIVFALFCWRAASLWGNYPTMIMVWSEKAPRSARAQIEVARMLYETGNSQQALSVLDAASTRIPEDFPLRMSQILVRCRLENVTAANRAVLLGLAKNQKYSHTWFNLMQRSLEWAANDSCRGITPVYVGEIAKAFIDQQRYPTSSQAYAQLAYLYGISRLYSGEASLAIQYLDASVSSRQDAQKLMSSAAYLATFGYREKALEYGRKASEIVESGDLHGRALGEAPQLSDINNFIEAVKRDE